MFLKVKRNPYGGVADIARLSACVLVFPCVYVDKSPSVCIPGEQFLWLACKDTDHFLASLANPRMTFA